MVVYFSSGGRVLHRDLCTTFLASVSSFVDALACTHHTTPCVWWDCVLVGTRTGETETSGFTKWGHRFSLSNACSHQLDSRSIIHLRWDSAVVDCNRKFLSLDARLSPRGPPRPTGLSCFIGTKSLQIRLAVLEKTKIIKRRLVKLHLTEL